MTDELLPPTSDIVFKMLFGDQHRTDILGPFLKAILLQPEDDFDELTILNPLLPKEFVEDKDVIVDVKAETRSGRRIDIEIQMQNHAALKNRIMLYAARMISEQVGEGDKYSKIHPVVCILITDFEMLENLGYHNRYRLKHTETGSEFTDLLEINVLELPKVSGDVVEGNGKLVSWLKFLKARSKEEMDMLAEQNPDIRKAVVRLVELSADEISRQRHEARITNWREKEAFADDARAEGWAGGREKGREEGRAEGEADGMVKVAKKMLKRNQPLEDICDFTGLSPKEVEALA